MRRRHFLCGFGAWVAVTMPRLLRAQQQHALPTVGMLYFVPSSTSPPYAAPFVRSMKDLGWEEGRNYRILAFTQSVDLVTHRVDVIVVFGDPSIKVVQGVTTTIPIVGMADDMVKSGHVASLAKPGGNTTGVSIFSSELDAKRLEVLHEGVPAAKRIGVLADPTTNSTLPQLDAAARALDLELVVIQAPAAISPLTEEEIAHCFEVLEAAHVDGVNVLASPILNNASALIIERASQMRLPAIYQFPETAEEGGLLAYGARLALGHRHVAGLVDKILRGARPEDLPVEQPTKFDLVVNLKTAKALGLTIPPSILTRAEEVIE